MENLPLIERERVAVQRLFAELGRHPGLTVAFQNVSGSLVIAIWPTSRLPTGSLLDFPWHVHVDEDTPFAEALVIACRYLEDQ